LDKDDEILAELRKIRELLAKPPEPPQPKGLAQEFKAFLSEYKVLGLAVAFIIAIYLGAVVKALVGDLILPIVQFALPPGSSNINGLMAGPFGGRRLCQRCAHLPHSGICHLPDRQSRKTLQDRVT
jgi:hypothetical protein